MPIVTLTTDFGLEDHYVGILKAVILRDAPKASIVDLTHAVPKFNISHGAMVLRQALEWFAPGTIHVAVVDPGVGGPRAVLALRYNSQYVICPDNGLITMVHRTWPFEIARRLNPIGDNGRALSHTFHGRDIMAPAAAYLARGESIERMGVSADGLELLDWQEPSQLPGGGLQGQVIYVDSFGNLVTNIHRSDMARAFAPGRPAYVSVEDREVGTLRKTYSDVPTGEGLALIGSSDLLELAVHRGNAAEVFAVEPGARITVK